MVPTPAMFNYGRPSTIAQMGSPYTRATLREKIRFFTKKKSFTIYVVGIYADIHDMLFLPH